MAGRPSLAGLSRRPHRLLFRARLRLLQRAALVLNQRWSVGDYLPSIFWRYQLNDWRTYGLGYPPEGTRWVLVDNQIYLIDEYDGYIIDVIYDAWRW